jgi:hypothetical protein
MNDRLVTLFGAAASLLVVIALLLPPGEMRLANSSRPTTTDRGEQGLQGLKTWLDANHMPSLSLRRRYTSLQVDPRFADSGNLIVVSVPQTTQPSRGELEALAEWIMQGNFILLLEAKNDRPAWSLGSGNDVETIPRALGFSLAGGKADVKTVDNADARRERSAQDLYEAGSALLGDDRQTVTLKPAFTHPVLEHVGSVSTFRSLIHDDPDITLTGIAGARQALPLLQRDASQGFALWAFRSGVGGGWVSSHPDLFGNVTLGLADNARLFANLAESVLGEHGYIIFDDMHFGVSDLYDPENFFSDPRLRTTLMLLGVLWVAYVFGYSNRLAPPAHTHRPARASDFVEAMAGFFARRLNAGAAARGILEHFYAEIRGFYRMTDVRTPVGTLLRNNSAVRDGDIRDLEELARNIGNNRNIDLIRLTRTIDRIKRTLQ